MSLSEKGGWIQVAPPAMGRFLSRCSGVLTGMAWPSRGHDQAWREQTLAILLAHGSGTRLLRARNTHGRTTRPAPKRCAADAACMRGSARPGHCGGAIFTPNGFAAATAAGVVLWFAAVGMAIKVGAAPAARSLDFILNVEAGNKELCPRLRGPAIRLRKGPVLIGPSETAL